VLSVAGGCERLVRWRAEESSHEGVAHPLSARPVEGVRSRARKERRERGCGAASIPAQRHHDIAVVDDDGVLVGKRQIEDSAAGFRQLLELLAEQTRRSEAPIPIAMETAKGLLPAALGAAGYHLFPINPLAVSRYRDRYVVSRAKSDPGDAFVLANILRTDLAAHRPLPADSELVLTIRVLARAQQDAVWERQQTANKLRCLLHEYYPTFLATFPGPGQLRRPGHADCGTHAHGG